MFEFAHKELGYCYCVTTITMLSTLAPAVHSISSFLFIRTIIKNRLHTVKLKKCLAPQKECGGEEKSCQSPLIKRIWN